MDWYMNRGKTPGYLAQYRAQVARQLGALARMFDVGIEGVKLVAEVGAACWTDYVAIFLNTHVLPQDVTRKQGLAHWLGALYHELGHILFSPRPTSPLGKRIAAELADFPAMWRVLNIVEDNRIERALIGLYPKMQGYLTTVVLAHVLDMIRDAQSGHWQVTKPLVSAWPLVAGRTWLPQEIRADVRAQWVAVHGEQTAARVATLIGQYQTLPNPGHVQVDRAYAILRELYVFLSQQHDQGTPQPGQDGPQGQPGGQGQGQGSGQSGAPTKGDAENVPSACGGVLQAPKVGGAEYPPDMPPLDVPTAEEADGDLDDPGGCSGGVQSDAGDDPQGSDQGDQGDDQGDQGDDQGAGSGGDQGTDQGDDQGAGSGGDQGSDQGGDQGGDSGDGEGQGGSDGDSNHQGDGQGTGQGDADGDGDGDGHGQSTDEATGTAGGTSGGPSGQGRYYTRHILDTGDSTIDGVVNAIEDAYERTLHDDAIVRDMDAILDAADRALEPKPTADKFKHGTIPATGRAYVRAEQLAEDLRHLRAQTRSGWQFGVDDGDLNIDRYITPTTNPGDYFDEWRPQSFKDTDVHVIVLLDLSGSMKNVHEPLIEALHMMHVASSAASVKFEALGFTSNYYILIPEDTDVDESLMLNVPIGGTTEPYHALQYAYERFSSSDTVHRLCMILSDGRWDTRKGEEVVQAMNAIGVDTVTFFLHHALYGTSASSLTQDDVENFAQSHRHEANDFYVVHNLDVLAAMVESLVRRKLEQATH